MKGELKRMNRTRSILLSSLLILLIFAPAAVKAQTAAGSGLLEPLQMLPASDVVLSIDHARIWDEAIPRILGENNPTLANLRKKMDEFKAKTGVDIRSIHRIAAGLRFVNPEAVTVKNIDKKDVAVVIISQGDFVAGKFVEAMRRDAGTRIREEKHGEQTIYYIEEPPKGSEPRSDLERVALAVIDQNTFALGDLMQVRATLDARTGGTRLSPELAALVTRHSNALISLAANVPPSLVASVTSETSGGTSEPEQAFAKFTQALSTIRQLSLSSGLTTGGVEIELDARLGGSEQAQSLADMLLGARQQYGVFIEDKTVRDLVSNIEVTAQGDEVRLRSELPQQMIAEMIKNAQSQGAAASRRPSSATQPTKKSQRRTRRSATRRTRRG